MKYYQNILKVIGRTPLVRLNLNGRNEARILAKLEFLNPSGSIKDRMALYMVEKAERRGVLKRGATIIEATTGNTGIALAMVAVIKGYQMLAVMPENMSQERQQLMAAFGAKFILTPKDEGPQGAINRRNELAKETRNSWVPGQFENTDNISAHQKTTGREIIEQAGGKVDAFVTGVGTGGTLMGVARALKRINPKVKIIAVEPKESAVISGKRPGSHHIQGIGEGFIPKIVDLKMIDWAEKVSSLEAERMAKRLAREEGILAGISSGANVVAAMRVAEKLGKGKTIVTVLPDRGERYFSMGVLG
ncbi:cysteine synthase A [Candidatus Shapirobacteria bacterium]|nr:cysteine synthase A [Candidatus Shapirobacteria bacterium]